MLAADVGIDVDDGGAMCLRLHSIGRQRALGRTQFEEEGEAMSIVENSPDMNIVNQINAALNDVRATLVELSELPIDRGHRDDMVVALAKARYQIDLAMTMILEHQAGKSISWSDRKPLVEEEFS
jgi:hypothetical protein